MSGMVRGLFGLAVSAAALLLIVAPAAAQDAASGTVVMTSKSISILVGTNWGDGTLTLPDGTKHNFSVEFLKGLSVGVSYLDGSGTVYNLKNYRDLEGTYTAFEGGLAAIAGFSGVMMKNEKGVSINLMSVQWGVNFTLGGGTVVIKFKEQLYP